MSFMGGGGKKAQPLVAPEGYRYVDVASKTESSLNAAGNRYQQMRIDADGDRDLQNRVAGKGPAGFTQYYSPATDKVLERIPPPAATTETTAAPTTAAAATAAAATAAQAATIPSTTVTPVDTPAFTSGETSNLVKQQQKVTAKETRGRRRRPRRQTSDAFLGPSTTLGPA